MSSVCIECTWNERGWKTWESEGPRSKFFHGKNQMKNFFDCRFLSLNFFMRSAHHCAHFTRSTLHIYIRGFLFNFECNAMYICFWNVHHFTCAVFSFDFCRESLILLRLLYNFVLAKILWFLILKIYTYIHLRRSSNVVFSTINSNPKLCLKMNCVETKTTLLRTMLAKYCMPTPIQTTATTIASGFSFLTLQRCFFDTPALKCKHARPYITFKLSSLSLSRSNILKCSIVSFVWSAHTDCIYYAFFFGHFIFHHLHSCGVDFRWNVALFRKCHTLQLHHFPRRSIRSIGSILKILRIFEYSFSNQNLNVFEVLQAAARIR